MRRRRRAWGLAVATLLVAGALNLLKGLDVEEALACWGLSAVLIWGRGAFVVRHDEAGWRGPLLRSVGVGASVLADQRRHPDGRLPLGPSGTQPQPRGCRAGSDPDPLPGPIAYRDPFDWVPASLALLWSGAAIAIAWQLFRPLARPRGLPPGELRPLARDLVESHGSDTLSFFKLRADKHHFFDRSRRAFVGYRIEAGTLLVSGDPVGPPDALPGLLRELGGFAEARGLSIGVVGASEEFAELAAGAGLGLLLHRRRGDRRPRLLFAGGAGDPQGAPGGDAGAQGRLHGFPAGRWASSRRRSCGASRRYRSAGAGRNPSEASRWRSTASVASTCGRASSWSPRTARASPAASSISFPATGGRPSPWA